MKVAIVLVALFGIALAATIQKPLIERTEVHDQHGQYALAYTTGEMAVAQQGALKLNADRTARVIVVQGSYSYRGADGKIYKVSYVADENGYRPVGEHIPVAS